MSSRTVRSIMVLAPAAAVSLCAVWTATEGSGRLAAHVKTDPVADSAQSQLEEGRRVFDTRRSATRRSGGTRSSWPGNRWREAGGRWTRCESEDGAERWFESRRRRGSRRGRRRAEGRQGGPRRPASTLVLLKANAIVGITGRFGSDGQLSSVGVQCALCHSTVDDSFAPGIGRRRDGWPNRDLNAGAIIALSPVLSADKKAVYALMGSRQIRPAVQPGREEAPRSSSRPRMAWRKSRTKRTRLRTESYWNAYVAVTQMGGRGDFADPRSGLRSSVRPISSAPRLPALRADQHGLPAPPPPGGSFDAAIAKRGRVVFDRTCASCHIDGAGTDNNSGKLPRRRKPASTERTRRAPQTRRIAPLLYVRSGSTHRISTTAAPPRSPTSWRTTTGFVCLGLTAEQQRTLSST